MFLKLYIIEYFVFNCFTHSYLANSRFSYILCNNCNCFDLNYDFTLQIFLDCWFYWMSWLHASSYDYLMSLHLKLTWQDLYCMLFLQLATRAAYGSALTKLGKNNEHVIALDGDMKNSTFSIKFKVSTASLVWLSVYWNKNLCVDVFHSCSLITEKDKDSYHI